MSELPHNAEAEEAVLGSILIDGSSIERIAAYLLPEHFHNERNRALYRAMLNLYERGEPVDVMSVDNELLNMSQRDAVGRSYPIKLVTRTPTSVHVEHYADIVYQMAFRRGGLLMAGKIAELFDKAAYEDLPDLANDKLNRFLARFDTGNGLLMSPNDIADMMVNEVEALRDKSGMLERPLKDVQKIIGPILPGTLEVWGARTGHGKSIVLLNEALHHAAQGKNVLLVTAENTVVQTMIRAYSHEVRLDNALIFRGEWGSEQHSVLLGAIEDFRKFPLWVCGHSGETQNQRNRRARKPHRISIGRIWRDAIRMQNLGVAPDLIVADFIQALKPSRPTGNIRTDIIEVVQGLKEIALEIAPVVTAAQVVRSVDDHGKIPTIANLQESGAIEQFSDRIGLLINWSMYYQEGDVINEITTETRRCKRTEWMILNGKQRWDGRHRSAGWIHARPEWAMLKDAARRYEQQYAPFDNGDRRLQREGE